jgi:hypothetical protein
VSIRGIPTVEKQDGVRSTVAWRIIDTTAAVRTPDVCNPDLQELMAEKLSLPLEVIQSVWLPVCLVEARLATFPGAEKPATPDVIRHEIAHIDGLVADLDGVYVILLADEEDGSPAVIGQLAVGIYAKTHCEPTIVAVRRGEVLTWHVADETVIDQVIGRLWDGWPEEA